jgi:RNA polymerase sigma factor (sigma-70 family)
LPDAPTTNTNLVLRLRNRADEAAWCEFVQIYEPLIHSLIRHKGFQHADAAELTQEVLLTVAGRVDRFEPDPGRGSFRGWLFTITRRLLINFLSCPARRFAGSGRTSVLARLLQQPSRDAGESQVFELELKRRLFQWAAERVKERVEAATWEAFWQTAVEARPVAAVARELRLTIGAVYVARSRVMRHMRLAVERQLKLNGWEGGRDG